MIFRELMEDCVAVTSAAPDEVEVLIATRTIDGVRMDNDGDVQLREIGSIEIDDADSEIKFIPRMISSGSSVFESPVSLATLQAFADTNPTIADFEVFTVDRRGLLDDGNTVSLNLPALGVCARSPTEVWILQPPQDQWPGSWFTDPA